MAKPRSREDTIADIHARLQLASGQVSKATELAIRFNIEPEAMAGLQMMMVSAQSTVLKKINASLPGLAMAEPGQEVDV